MSHWGNQLANQPATGKERQALIASAISHARAAHDSGNYVECISIVDSVISERLTSIFKYSGELTRSNLTINQALIEMRRQKIIWFDLQLPIEIGKWARARNLVLHGLTKPDAFDGINTWIGRMGIAKDASKAGLKLLRRVTAEVKKHKI